MDEEDQEKIAFIASQGLYCYKVMPFGLKNARATYQRLVNQMFNKQIGRKVEVYINDMLVKSKEEEDHLDDLRETFNTLRQYNMKLNPSKCDYRFKSYWVILEGYLNKESFLVNVYAKENLRGRERVSVTKERGQKLFRGIRFGCEIKVRIPSLR